MMKNVSMVRNKNSWAGEQELFTHKNLKEQRDGDEIHQYGDTERIKAILKRSLTLLERCKELDFECDRGIVTVGCTGSGKSTLVQLLMGETLKVHQHSRGNCQLSYMIPDDQGDYTESPTDLPTRFDEDDIALWDMPGVRDSRSLAYSIMGAYYTSKIIKHASYISFLLVVGVDDLDHSRGLSIINIMKHLFHMVEDPFSIIDHTVLVITKNIWLKDSIGVRELLKNSLKENTKNFTEEEIKFFNKFYAAVQIAFFNLPNSYGMTNKEMVNATNNESLRSVKDDIISKVKFIADVAVRIPQNIVKCMKEVQDILYKKNEKNSEKLKTILRNICSIESGNSNKERYQMIWVLRNFFKSFKEKQHVTTFHPLNSLADAFVCVEVFNMAERDAMRKRTDDIATLFKLGSKTFKKIIKNEEWDRTLSTYNLDEDLSQKDIPLSTTFSFFISNIFKRIASAISRDLSTQLVGNPYWTYDKKKQDASDHYYCTRIKPKICPVDIADLNVDRLRKKFPFLITASDKAVLLPEK